MPKRSRNLSSDPNAAAFQIVQQATSQPPAPPTTSQMAAALGRLGGLKGGKARAAKLSPERRQAIAKKAAKERWKKKSS